MTDENISTKVSLAARDSSGDLIKRALNLANKAAEALERGNLESARVLNKRAENVIEQLENPNRQGSRDL